MTEERRGFRQRLREFRRSVSPRPPARGAPVSVSITASTTTDQYPSLSAQGSRLSVRPASPGGVSIQPGSPPENCLSQPQALALSPSPNVATGQRGLATILTSPNIPPVLPPASPLIVTTGVLPVIVSSPPNAASGLNNSNHTSSTPGFTAIGSSASLWTLAFNKLSEADRGAFASIDPNKDGYSEEILEEIKRHRDLCQQSRWKFSFRGKDIIIRDIVDKLLTWAEKFKNIGDIIIQFDPVHAALPWAGVRALLQISLADKEAMGVIMIGVERIAALIVRSAIYEELYFRWKSTTTIQPMLEECLLELYYTILEFLACAKRYLGRSIATRMMRTLLDIEGTKSLFDAIEQKESDLEKELKAAERNVQSNHQTTIEGKYGELKAFLEELEKPILRMDSNISLMYGEIQGHFENDKRNKILMWLSQVEYIKHHRMAKEGLLENTGQWLLNKKDYREWRSSSASGILWLHGIPGAGKTKLTCMVIDHLAALTHAHEPVVYFYCNRNEAQRGDPEVILQAIVKQLSVVFPCLPRNVLVEYETREKDGAAAGSLGFDESRDLIISLLDIYPQTTIIIDALDESDPDKRWQLLQALRAIIASSTSLVKVFVSSRDDIDIKLALEQVPNLYIDARDNYGDIERFVVREIEDAIQNKRLLHGVVSPELKGRIITTIVQMSQGMFQWANLQIKHLYKLKLPSEIVKNLGKLPKTLGETYSQIWNEIMSGTPREQELAKKALMWVMCSITPLGQESWADFSYWPEKTPDGGVDTLFDLCRNLVTWDQQLDRVVFAHLSVQEYLEASVFSSVDANLMAAKTCMTLFISPAYYSPVVEEYEGISFSRYSTFHWSEHVKLSYNDKKNMSKDMCNLLIDFLGTEAKPGKAYRKWLATTDDYYKMYLMYLDWGYNHITMPIYFTNKTLIYLRSIPLNPLFALAYFSFGEELYDSKTYDNFDVNSKNESGQSLLYVASSQGNDWFISFLLEKGAFVSRGLLSPVIAAVSGGHGQAVAKLLEKYEDIFPINTTYTNILEVLVRDGSVELIREMVPSYPNVNVTEAILLAATNLYDGKAIIEILLTRDDKTNITEAVMLSAMKNSEIMTVLLTRNNNIEITEAVLIAAAASYDKETMGMLLARGSKITITESIMLSAAKNRFNGQEIIEMLARDNSIEITKAVILAAIADGCYTDGIMSVLEARDDDKITITEAITQSIATDLSKGIIEMLLASVDETEITEAIILANTPTRIGEDRHGWGTIKMLLARVSNIKITKAVLWAVVLDHDHGKEAVEMLLVTDKNIEITQAVILEAVANSYYCREIIEVLLTQGNNIEVTEAVMILAVTQMSNDAIEMLLSRDKNIEITEAVIIEAVKYRGIRIIKALLARYNNIEITGAVMVAVVKHWDGDEVVEMLLARYNNIEITGAVLVAAAAGMVSKDTMNMLLARGNNIEITEAMMIAAVKHSRSSEKIQVLLARENNIEITEAVLVAAAKRLSKDNMDMLLARGNNIEITEAVMIAAVKNWGGDEIVETLLARYNNIEITEAVLVAAAKRLSKDTMDLLLARYNNVDITEAVMIVVVKDCESNEIVEMLLARYNNIEITEAVMIAAVKHCKSDKIVETLLARYNNIEITEALILKAIERFPYSNAIKMLLSRDNNIKITEGVILAAESWLYTDLMEMLLARDENIEITEAIIITAASQERTGFMEMLLSRDKNIEITEAIILATARGPSGDTIFDMFLCRDGSVRITKAVIEAVQKNWDCGRRIMKILRSLEPVSNTYPLETNITENSSLNEPDIAAGPSSTWIELRNDGTHIPSKKCHWCRD